MDSSKERKKLHRWEQKNRWMGHYELKYGVLPIEYGPPVAAPVSNTVGAGDAAMATAATAAAVPTVLKAKCRFCECFGREAPPSASSPDFLTTKAVAAAAAAAAGLEFPGSPMASSSGDATAAAAALDETSSNADDSTGGAHGHGHGGPLKRRKKRQTLKVFGPNFRTDNLESHLTREHPVKWKEYERLRDADKKAFFPDGPAGGELAASAKELLLAQQVAAAANAAAAMNVATRNAMAAAAAAASTSTSGTIPSSHGHAHGSNKLAALAGNGGGAATAQIKHMVPTEILAMVEQLLASAALRQQQATSLTQQDAGASGWQSFVREDETLADTLAGVDDSEAHTATASTAAASGSTATGDCKVLGAEFGTVALKHEPLFLYIVDMLCLRPSLDTTLAMVQAAQRLVPDAAALLGGLTLTDVAGAVHQLVALNLSCIAQLLSFAWGYSLFLRFVTHNNTGFVDVRVQVAVNDELHDLHLVSLPLDAGKHTVDALGAAIVKALTTVDARALEKIVGLTIDGDHFHMHKYKDVGLWLKRQVEEATEQAAFYVLYSGAYHVSFIVDELLDHCQADQHFLSTLADLEALCRGNTSLRGLMGPELTRFASAHWVSVFNECEWLTVHRETILKWASENDQHLAKLPSTQWWITLFVLRDVLKDVYAAFKKCREHSGSLADVQKHLRDLVFQLRLKFNIKPTMASDAGEVAGVASSATAAELVVELSAAAAGGGSHGSSASATTAAEVAAQLDPCEFSYQDFVSFVIPLDLFMYEAFQLKSIEGITDEDRVALYQRFHLVLMLLVNKVLAVINSSPESPVPDAATTSSSNSPHQYAMQIPPSIPYDFITMNNVAAMDVLNQQRFRIRSKWTGKVLAMITEDRNRMMAEFAQPSALYEAATNGAKLQQSGAFSFREAWKPFAVEFPSLASFAVVFGGLLSVTCASDDELAHYFYNTNQYAAPTLTLEAHLHAAQFHKLHMLRRQGDATIV